MPALTTLEPGTVVAGTYRLVKVLGRGGMGEVFEAVHERTGAPLAIKVLLSDFSDRAEVLSRFRREAEITSRLRHPNIVKVFDFDRLPDGRPFLVMELLSGKELGAALEPGKARPPAQVLAIVDQVALALAAAHGVGVVHRDLSPGNIFVERLPGTDRELVRVLDFGISKVRGARSALTQTASVMGTPYYMSPEQALGRTKETDVRADQFALGAIAYELFTGQRAFASDDPSSSDPAPAVLYRVVHAVPPTFASLGLGWLGPAEVVVLKAMAKEPAQRYPSVMAFAEELAAAVRECRAPAAPPPSTAPSAPSAPAPSERQATTLRRATGELGAAPADGALAGIRRWPLGRGATVGLGSAIVVVVALVVAIRQGRSDRSGADVGDSVTAAATAFPTSGGTSRAGESANPVSGGTAAAETAAAVPAPAVMARPAAVGENVPRLPGSKPSILSMPQPGTPSTVEVGVDGAPRGASAWDGDRRLEIPLRLAAGSGAHRVTFRADGYKDLILEIPAEAGKRVSLKAMQRLPPPRATRRAPSPAPPPAARHQPPPRPQPAQPPPKQQPADGPRKRQAPRPRNEDIL